MKSRLLFERKGHRVANSIFFSRISLMRGMDAAGGGCFLMLNIFSNIIQRKRRAFFRKNYYKLDLVYVSWGHYNVHTQLLDVQERSCLGRDHRSKNTWKRLRQNDCFLPAENDSSLVKGPSWRLSAEVIYWKTAEKRLEVLQVGKNLLFTVLRTVCYQVKNTQYWWREGCVCWYLMWTLTIKERD